MPGDLSTEALKVKIAAMHLDFMQVGGLLSPME